MTSQDRIDPNRTPVVSTARSLDPGRRKDVGDLGHRYSPAVSREVIGATARPRRERQPHSLDMRVVRLRDRPYLGGTLGDGREYAATG